MFHCASAVAARNSVAWFVRVCVSAAVKLNIPPRTSFLILDDSEDTIGMLEQLLTLSGANVATATNGEDALRLAHDHEFDVILSDISMPEMDGFEFLQRLRKIDGRQHVPVVAIRVLAALTISSGHAPPVLFAPDQAFEHSSARRRPGPTRTPPTPRRPAPTTPPDTDFDATPAPCVEIGGFALFNAIEVRVGLL